MADTRMMCSGLNASMISFAFDVLFSCSSSIMTMNLTPSWCASSIFSKRFFRSPSLSALFFLRVTSSQLMKVTLLPSNPHNMEYGRERVSICGASASILSLLCSSRLPFPGQSQMNAVLPSVFLRYVSTYFTRITVFPAPVGALTVTICFVPAAVVLS